jgi:uncharacterized membrane protein
MTRRWFGLALIGAMLVLAVWAYGRLPEQVPSHWNAQGEVDAYSGRWIVLMAPGIALVTWLLMPVLRRIDPRSEHFALFEGTFWLVINVIIAFLFVVHVMVIGAGLGWPMPGVDRMMMMGTGVMLLVLGNYLPRVRSNWWMGIRTPWTLSSEQVWRTTHRLGGRTFMIGGVLVLAGMLLPAGQRVWVMVAAVAVSVLIPAVWSYVAWRREQQAASG